MKFFLDTEFIEKVTMFPGEITMSRIHFLQLISIGIVCEDGRCYYAIYDGFDPHEANEWVKENVISKLPKLVDISLAKTEEEKQKVLLYKGMQEIKTDLINFFGCSVQEGAIVAPEGIEVYAYYADYDWVTFCSIFGSMIDLPKNFPMYCIDLKQSFDQRVLDYAKTYPLLPRWSDKKEQAKIWKARSDYPTQENEHNALDDAKWNQKLYHFIKEVM